MDSREGLGGGGVSIILKVKVRQRDCKRNFKCSSIVTLLATILFKPYFDPKFLCLKVFEFDNFLIFFYSENTQVTVVEKPQLKKISFPNFVHLHEGHLK